MPQTEMCSCLSKLSPVTGLVEDISNKSCPIGSGAPLRRDYHNGDLLYRLKIKAMPQRYRGFMSPGCKVRTHQAGIVSQSIVKNDLLRSVT